MAVGGWLFRHVKLSDLDKIIPSSPQYRDYTCFSASHANVGCEMTGDRAQEQCECGPLEVKI